MQARQRQMRKFRVADDRCELESASLRFPGVLVFAYKIQHADLCHWLRNRDVEGDGGNAVHLGADDRRSRNRPGRVIDRRYWNGVGQRCVRAERATTRYDGPVDSDVL